MIRIRNHSCALIVLVRLCKLSFSIWLTCLYISLSLHLCLSFFLSIFLFLCLYISIYLFPTKSFCFSMYISVCLCASLPSKTFNHTVCLSFSPMPSLFSVSQFLHLHVSLSLFISDPPFSHFLVCLLCILSKFLLCLCVSQLLSLYVLNLSVFTVTWCFCLCVVLSVFLSLGLFAPLLLFFSMFICFSEWTNKPHIHFCLSVSWFICPSDFVLLS